ncbi:MAG: imidazole glycerol phosphate synthase subunit HisH [Phycisphaerae bacterium]|nr:MAG: imidazole glycerol phosphate synthase subunit HisH [Phycisphaerae bacterium]
MIGVVDYGAGNLQSVGNALDHLGVSWQLAESDADFDCCDRMILPGVGHFRSAMTTLVETRQDQRIKAFAASGKPLLGICLGAQLLLETSEESPGLSGLGLISGDVTRLKSDTVPHMGWNRVRANGAMPILGDDLQERHFYFAHSYVCEPKSIEHRLAVTKCGTLDVCVAVGCENVMGVQFHPEKSGAAGLQLLERFARC